MFRKLLTLDEAQRVIQKHAPSKSLGTERVPLLKAHDRVLAENVVAKINIPPFDRSTVDGFAVKAEDTFGAEENKPVRLKVRGTAVAGELPRAAVSHGSAVEIVTGAPVPDGSDGVVMLEQTERKNGELFVYSPVAAGENIMKAGSDIKNGEAVLKKGQSLGSREIGVLAALGSSDVKVYAIPRVAVLSTGAEVTEPGRKLGAGKIYDINAYSLSAAVLESGGEPLYLGVFPDDMEKIRKVLRKALAAADIVVTSGGVSVGPKDFMPRTLDSLGKPGVIVCGVAIKPGKPVTVASMNGKPVFSLPGHPTSALLVFHLLARPVIQKMAGRKAEDSSCVKAVAGERMFPAKGRRTFVMVTLKCDDSGRLTAEPVPTGASGAITTLSKAEGFVEIAEDQQFIDADEEVVVHLFKP